MNLKWLKGAKTPEAKKKRKEFVLANYEILYELKEILLEDLKALEANELKLDVYDVSNWAYLQADSNGAKRTLNQVIDLITLKDTK
jgi:hypothetical protein